ncbi:MAG TPA: hypothetical protein VM100_14125 [Longimicrobiales bacterium]|nr:hypothetical protein [Longimicrobiales bacterium]
MDTPEKKITRRDLPAVVKRAAELAAIDDPDDQISEDEVIRIAAELGLPARHVKAALYEGAREEAAPTFLARQFGDRLITASRAVPLEESSARRWLENHFTTEEYMTVVRRQPDLMILEPAGDAMSRFVRAFKRGKKHQLSSAQMLEVRIRSLEPGWSHVYVRAAFSDERKGHFAGAIVGGTLLGASIGAFGGLATGALTNDFIVALTTGSVIGVGSGAAIFAGILSSLRTHYREWRERTTLETEGTLDHLEKRPDTVAGITPWFKKLQKKLEEL